ncbi:Ig-like domain-containing protein [Actinophytocola sp.]|uniref:L,D-transpeptidase n=1 Tax=Actinophytocola sp. TaxID=1872138 RepID=UPI003899FB67
MGAATTVVAAIALLTSCTSSEGGSANPVDKKEMPAKIAFAPADGAKDVAVTDPVKITASGGELTAATVTNPEGQPIKGQLAADKKSWTSAEVLGYGKTYSYTATAKNPKGKESTQKGSFSTLTPGSTPRATINPSDNATVGVGMPVSVKFPEGGPAKEERAAVEKALKIETSQPVEGSWAWISKSQVDWRPKEYWPANTQVKVTANLYGLSYGGGAYGKADLTTSFTVGRNQVVKIHTPDHVMNVYRDGQLTASYPSSNGLDGDPDRTTPNGTVIVMEKDPIGDFSNPKYGYTNVMKKWAVRISNHGEFIHENNDNAANIGKKNSSHGCVNLLETDAKAYFDSALIGDPVEITGSVANYPTTSDVFDWLISWDQWKSMSALT